MRRILLLMVLLVLAAVNTSFASPLTTPPKPDKAPAVISMAGEIKEITGRGVLIAADDKKTLNILAKVFEDTYIYSDEKNEFINITELKVGQAVTVYHSPAMTRSIPPQAKAFAIIVGKGVNMARYCQVDEVYTADKGSSFLTDNGSLIVRSQTVQNGLKNNDELLVWHGPVAMSMPGQTNAKKIINLSALKKGKITIHLGAGVMAVNGQEIQITQGKPKADVHRIYKQGKTYMLPLAPIAKALDIKFAVSEDKGVVMVNAGSELAELNLGSKKCKFAGSTLELVEAPKIKNGEIVVPMDFFLKVLNVKVQLLNTAI